jgi:YD repeat-containing protein
LKTKRDARGIKTIYDYDKVGRITTRCYRVIGTGALGSATCDGNTETAEPNTPDVNYFYDGKGLTTTANFARGNLTKVHSTASQTLYTNFDNQGRLLSHQQITDGNTYDTSYKYNLSGALIKEKYPSGKVVRNFLNADGALSKVVRNGKVYASDFSYTSAGAIEKMRLGNGNGNRRTTTKGFSQSRSDSETPRITRQIFGK